MGTNFAIIRWRFKNYQISQNASKRKEHGICLWFRKSR